MTSKPTYATDFDAQRQIAIVWSVEDVQALRPDLSDADAFEVLCFAKQEHDSCIGLNWDVLESAADHLYPQVADASA